MRIDIFLYLSVLIYSQANGNSQNTAYWNRLLVCRVSIVIYHYLNTSKKLKSEYKALIRILSLFQDDWWSNGYDIYRR